MKNIILITAHNDHEMQLPYGIWTWKWYAKKHNIDIIVANDVIKSDYRVGSVCSFKKWGNLELLSREFDRVLMVDTDVMVRWDAPNIFDTFADVVNGMVLDAGGFNVGMYHLRQWADAFHINQKLYDNKYCNAGVALLSKKNYEIISFEMNKYFEYWINSVKNATAVPDAMDQTPTNIIMWNECDGVTLLDDRWNNMVMSKYDDGSFINDSYIWHFTGPRLGGWGNKENIMQQVFNQIKHKYE
jgi:hypothetical protein